MRWLRQLSIFAGVFLLGLLIGPLCVAALTAFQTSGDPMDRTTAAYRLLRTFDDQYLHEITVSSMDIDVFARDCGYDPGQLFGADQLLARGQEWNPRTGYFDLSLWYGDEFRDAVRDRRAAELDSRFSAFELTFLERCIRATAFSELCNASVETVLDSSRLLSRTSLPDKRPDQRRRYQTICAYLDGIAARRSFPLTQQRAAGEGQARN